MNFWGYLSFLAITGAICNAQRSDIGWQCLNHSCEKCSLTGDDHAGCAYDGPGFYATKEECEKATGCGPMKWQCTSAAKAGEDCTSCNTTAGAGNSCEPGANLYMTKLECEASTNKCGVQCPTGRVFTPCSTCQPSCEDPTTLSCSPWYCIPGCACPPGTFKAKNGDCIKAQQCPKITGKRCFNIVLRNYGLNEGNINKTTWPYHQDNFFIPACTENGDFAKLQCYQRAGGCVCVKPATGVPVRGTRKRIREGIPDCESVISTAVPPTLAIPATQSKQCLKANEEYTACSSSSCLPSCEHPNPMICTADCWSGCKCKKGYFRDTNGECVTGSQCGATTECRKQVFTFTDDEIRTGDKVFIPTCDRKGLFERRQCDGSHCWCVDPKTGKGLTGPTTSNTLDCNSEVKKSRSKKPVNLQ